MYLLTYDMDELDLNGVAQILHALKDQFPQKNFFAIPNVISLMQCDKEGLTMIRNFIDTLLKNKEKEG